jgi:hypothetical protein
MKVSAITKPVAVFSAAVIKRAMAIFDAKKKRPASQPAAANSARMFDEAPAVPSEAALTAALETLTAAEVAALVKAVEEFAAAAAQAPVTVAAPVVFRSAQTPPPAVRAPIPVFSPAASLERSARTELFVNILNSISDPSVRAQFWADNEFTAWGPTVAINGAERRAMLQEAARISDSGLRSRTFRDINAHPAQIAIGAEYRRLVREFQAIEDSAARAQFWADHLSLNN